MDADDLERWARAERPRAGLVEVGISVLLALGAMASAVLMFLVLRWALTPLWDLIVSTLGDAPPEAPLPCPTDARCA